MLFSEEQTRHPITGVQDAFAITILVSSAMKVVKDGYGMVSGGKESKSKLPRTIWKWQEAKCIIKSEVKVGKDNLGVGVGVKPSLPMITSCGQIGL